MKPNHSKKIYVPICVHELINTDGIITCSKCNTKAILYLKSK
jgi:hypothetical protein